MKQQMGRRTAGRIEGNKSGKKRDIRKEGWKKRGVTGGKKEKRRMKEKTRMDRKK